MTPLVQFAAGLLIGSAAGVARKVRRLKGAVANEMARTAQMIERTQFFAGELAGFHVALLLLVDRAGGEVRIPLADIGQVNLIKTHIKVEIDPANQDRVFRIIEEILQ